VTGCGARWTRRRDEGVRVVESQYTRFNKSDPLIRSYVYPAVSGGPVPIVVITPCNRIDNEGALRDAEPGLHQADALGTLSA